VVRLVEGGGLEGPLRAGERVNSRRLGQEVEGGQVFFCGELDCWLVGCGSEDLCWLVVLGLGSRVGLCAYA